MPAWSSVRRIIVTYNHDEWKVYISNAVIRDNASTATFIRTILMFNAL
jgi:hypothetical protein